MNCRNFDLALGSTLGAIASPCFSRASYYVVLMNHVKTVEGRWSNVVKAVREGCEKTCELGPEVLSLSQGPDGNPQVCITACRAHCAFALQRGLEAQGAEHPVRKALSKAGGGFITTGHFDEGEEPSRS